MEFYKKIKYMKTKLCKCCKKRKSKNKFHKNKSTKDGLNFYCIKCKQIKQKNYRDANIESYIKREKEYRITHADEIYEYQKKYYSRPEVKERVKKYFKDYQKKNRKALNKYMNEYKYRNREEVNKKALEYYYKNRERILEQQKERRNKQLKNK